MARRATTPFRSTEEILKAVPQLGRGARLGVNSQFFEVRGRLRLDQLVVEERSLVQRDFNRNVRTLWRERTLPQPAEASPPTAAR